MIKRFYTAFTIYIMVMLYAPPVYSINFFFSHLGVEDGLSQVSVLDIFQDSDGYIWFGTRNGANRYDGYEFVVYQNEVNNNATLTDNYIRGFAEDNRKNIWIATSNGINCIDYKTKKITRFYPKSINKECTTNIINRLLKHSDGNVYAFCNRSVFKCSMNQTVQNRISKSFLSDYIVPTADRKLACNDCGSLAVAVFDDFHQIQLLLSIKMS